MGFERLRRAERVSSVGVVEVMRREDILGWKAVMSWLGERAGE